MKYKCIPVCLFFVLFAGLGAGFAQDDLVNLVGETIKVGNSKELAKYFGPSLEVSIESKLNSYSKQQAEFVLRDFFKQHPPKDFKIIHKGSSRVKEIPYAVGEYVSGDVTYRVYIKFKNHESKLVVSEIQFER